jgi:hypothetical protein
MTIGSTSSGREALHPSWMRWLIPSIGDLIFVALLALLAYASLTVRLLGDAGIGWHIRTGQLILATHSVPRVDPFSSTLAGQPWFAWEWLYDVVVGGLEHAAGLNGVVVFTALIIALTFSWTFRLLLRRGANLIVALLLVLLAVSAAMIHVLARPHVISWLFTVLWFWILETSGENIDSSSRNSRSHTRALWLLPLLMVVWVNVHGGFLLGFVLLGIYWLSAACQLFRRGNRFEDALQEIRAGKGTRELALIGMLSALATFVNPYGWSLHVHIYRYLSNRFLMDHIDEFQSPNFHFVAQKCFAVLLLFTLVALAFAGRDDRGSKIGLAHGLLVLFAVYSGLYASRNIPVSALLLILVIGPQLSSVFEALADFVSTSRHFLQRMQTIESGLRGHLWPLMAILLTCWVAFHGGKLGSKPLLDTHFDSKRFPVGAINYLQRQKIRDSVFAPDYWGGYLIYRLYPQMKVVIDDRHDFYGEAFLKSYLQTMHVEPEWQKFLDEHEVHLIVIPKDSALANILLETPRWQAIYNDDVAIVFTQTHAPMH